MTHEIPKYVQAVYISFGIKAPDWDAHFEVDTDERGRLRPEVRALYEMLHRGLREAA